MLEVGVRETRFGRTRDRSCQREAREPSVSRFLGIAGIGALHTPVMG
jgi:hypothetical protein